MTQVRFLPPQLTEVIRPVEEPVLKTGGGLSRLRVRVSRLPLTTMRPWCNGSMTGSNPVGQGSSPWGRACGRTFACEMGSSSNRKMPASHAGDPGAIPGESTEHSPVAQWRRQLPYKETTGGSSPPRTTRQT